MEKHIYEVSPTFNFEQLSLANPTPVQGGSYCTKLFIGDKNSFFIQLPRCKTKCGMVKTGKKIYCDLLFSNNEDNALIQWLESLENRCQDLIYEKKDLWFQNEMDKNDIESMMVTTIRLYKSGKFILMRVSIPTSPLKTSESLQKCLIFDEQQNIKTYDDISPETYIIPLVCFSGIKFTSKDIRLEITLTQLMLLDQPELSTNCMIKLPVKQLPYGDTGYEAITPTDSQEDTLEEAAVTALEGGQTEEHEVGHVGCVEESVLTSEKVVEPNLVDQTGLEISKPEKNQEVESLEKVSDSSYLGNEKGLEEVDLDFAVLNDSIKLKNPNEVYMEIYKAARVKAKQMRYAAIEAYLEANKIKTKYMLNDLEDSDDDLFFDEENTDTYLAENN